jgi:hypothetical protein
MRDPDHKKKESTGLAIVALSFIQAAIDSGKESSACIR